MKTAATALLLAALAIAPVSAQDASAPPAGGDQMEAAEASPLTADIKLGTGIENREAVGVQPTLPAGSEQIAGWTRIEGASEPTTVTHVWLHEGREMDRIDLDVTSSSYRTWSRKSVGGLTGTWTLEVRDAQGRLVGKGSVVVSPPAGDDGSAGAP